ncbi:MAG TPA: biopolymer transporter ExbD [Trueperaceae bacterium]
MRRQTRYYNRQPTLLDLTPMVDVVFLLIIFFMVSTTFITLESGLPVDLPQAQSATAQSSEVPTVTVNSEGAIFVAGSQVQQADLAAALRTRLEASGQGTVVLRADQSVPHGLIVRVMDLIRQAGAQRISIATGG